MSFPLSGPCLLFIKKKTLERQNPEDLSFFFFKAHFKHNAVSSLAISVCCPSQRKNTSVGATQYAKIHVKGLLFKSQLPFERFQIRFLEDFNLK